MPDGATQRLAEFVSRAHFGDLPSEVVSHCERAVLEWLGSALAGSLERPAILGRRVVQQLGDSDACSVFPAERSSAAGAALANGVASHILELDDVHKGSTLHAAAPVIPAALAMAEREGASGEAFLLAVALGYDVALRVGEAVNPSHYRFWHPTGTAATFGAAAAASSLLGLDATGVRDALGSAGTQASGLWEFNADGSMSKHLHPGKAAMNGVLAADLAHVQFTGASRILEGERGFFRATAQAADPTRITEALGTHWKVTENCYKLHACCGHTHSAIDVALEQRAAWGWSGSEAVADLHEVIVETYGPGYEIVKEANPKTPYQAKFSLAYVVAVALLEGQVGLGQFGALRFGPDGVVEVDAAALLERIRVRVAPDLTSRYPAEWGTRVTFVHADGRREQRESAFPRGNPEHPVSTDVLREKARALLAARFRSGIPEAALAWVDGLREARDMRSHTRRLMTAIVDLTARRG
ncbi:MAG: MmgE/PrpD family protein [Gemmatimonadetes bacterium]|nr:MmgE/PrpD family protein [Gemmatimonadota bacterium]